MKLKILTFNIRFDTPSDGINYQPNRFGRIKDLLVSASPDIIGFQETKEMARKWLNENLPNYTVLGCGRTEGFKNEGVTMAFKRDLFDVVSFNTEWLSLEPEVPNSTYGGDQSIYPRVLQTALLVPRDGSEAFVFANVHLDHIGKDARKLGAAQTLRRLLAQPYKFILTGDFNALPDDGSIELITKCSVRSINDITASLGGTFHDYGRRTTPSKIDYIFTDFDSYENVHIIEDKPVDGVYYSDHYAIAADIEI